MEIKIGDEVDVCKNGVFIYNGNIAEIGTGAHNSQLLIRDYKGRHAWENYCYIRKNTNVKIRMSKIINELLELRATLE